MDELEKKLLEDIEKTGFPSELKAAQVFSAGGDTVYQNEHYIDYDENKGREIDLSVILAAISQADEALYTVTDFLYAEVKRSASKPWVVFTSEALWSDFSTECIMHGTTFKEQYELTSDDLFSSHPAKNKPRLGRTAYQAFWKGGNTDPHVWVLGALKAAKYLRQSVADQREHPRPSSNSDARFAVISIATPLVVLDGLLFEAHLEEERIKVILQNHIVYSCHYSSHRYKWERNLVDIVTLDFLPQYIKEHKEWLQSMADYIRDHPKILPRSTD